MLGADYERFRGEDLLRHLGWEVKAWCLGIDCGGWVFIVLCIEREEGILLPT